MSVCPSECISHELTTLLANFCSSGQQSFLWCDKFQRNYSRQKSFCLSGELNSFDIFSSNRWRRHLGHRPVTISASRWQEQFESGARFQPRILGSSLPWQRFGRTDEPSSSEHTAETWPYHLRVQTGKLRTRDVQSPLVSISELPRQPPTPVSLLSLPGSQLPQTATAAPWSCFQEQVRFRSSCVRWSTTSHGRACNSSAFQPPQSGHTFTAHFCHARNSPNSLSCGQPKGRLFLWLQLGTFLPEGFKRIYHANRQQKTTRSGRKQNESHQYRQTEKRN